MENLISGIQHFLITAFTTITTVVVIVSPFYKPQAPIHLTPIPSPTQEIQVKNEATPSAKPSPISQEKQTVSQPANIPLVTPSPASVLADCIGPDGKVSKLTKSQCDDFNAAWNKSPAVKGESTTTNSQTNNPNWYGNTSGNTSSTNNNYPNYVFPTYPPINTGNSQQLPTNTPVPVNNSLNLQICLSNAESYYNSQMEDLNRRGFLYSGQADQVRNNYASQQQSCHQQYGN